VGKAIGSEIVVSRVGEREKGEEEGEEKRKKG
jgi:hypothetical protein